MTAQAPATAAGRRLLDFWLLHRELIHGVRRDLEDAIPDDIAEAEAESAAAERAAIRARIGKEGHFAATACDEWLLAILDARDAGDAREPSHD